MGHTLKKIAKIAGIAALGFFTFGAGAALLGGATLGTVLGTTVVLGGSAVALSTIATVGLGLLAVGNIPDLPKSLEDTGANSRGRAFADPNALGVFAFGETTVPCALVFEQLHGTDDNLITNVFAHAWHEIEGYVSLTVDGEEVTFSGDDAQGDYAGILTWRRKTGAPGQAALTLPGTDWPLSTPKFAGVAYSSMTWDFRDQDKLKGGIPTRLDMVVKGAKLYDPRQDPAYGSGTQDFDDPTTWTYPSTNPGNAVLVLLRFLIGEYSSSGQLIWGRGAAEGDFDMETFVAMANVADEALDGGFRFSLAGIHLLDGSLEGFVRRWEEETGGKLSKSGGLYRVWLPHDDLTALTTITADKLLAGSTVGHTIAGDIRRYFNTARGRYIEPEEGYRGFPYPEVTDPAAVTLDGGKRILPNDFSWIQSRSLAERIARLKIRRSRFQRVWTVTMGWEGQHPNYRPFTVHHLNLLETSNTNQLVRVIDRRLSFNGVTQLVLQEEDAQIYDDTDALGSPFTSDTIPKRLDRLGTVTPRFVGSLNLEINVELDGSANAHEAILYGFTGGTPNRDVDGFIHWNGQKITIERVQMGNNTIVTNDSDTTSVGWIAFDTAKTDPFTVFSTPCDVAFVRKIGDQWQYDNNSAWVNFTPTATMVALGWMEKGASGIANAGLFGQPIALELAPGARTRHGADVTSEQSVNGCENPEFEAGPTGWETTTGWEIVNDPTNARSGSWCLKLTGAVNFIYNRRDMQVSPGDRVLAQIHGKRTAGTVGTIQVGIEFRDSSGVAITAPQGNTVSASSYTQSRVVGVAPANAVTATLFIDCDDTDGSFVGYVDGCFMGVNVRDADIDALETTHGPAEDGADVTGNNPSAEVLNGIVGDDSDGIVVGRLGSPSSGTIAASSSFNTNFSTVLQMTGSALLASGSHAVEVVAANDGFGFGTVGGTSPQVRIRVNGVVKATATITSDTFTAYLLSTGDPIDIDDTVDIQVRSGVFTIAGNPEIVSSEIRMVTSYARLNFLRWETV